MSEALCILFDGKKYNNGKVIREHLDNLMRERPDVSPVTSFSSYCIKVDGQTVVVFFDTSFENWEDSTRGHVFSDVILHESTEVTERAAAVCGSHIVR